MPGSNIRHTAVKDVSGELFSDKPEELFEAFFRDSYCFFLDSGSSPERLGRYSILGSRPSKIIRYVGGLVEIETGGGKERVPGDPLRILETLLNEKRVEYSGPLPFVGGAVGFLGYDLCQLTEGIALTKPNGDGLPDLEFGLYDSAVVCDNLEGRVWLTACGRGKGECGRLLKSLRERLGKKPPTGKSESPPKLRMESDYTREGYIAAVKKIKECIREGDVYQVNISQRFSADAHLDCWGLYKRLRMINPAPFAAYIGFDDSKIVCSSPERFLKARDGVIETRPIKGTRPRGADAGEDARLADELLRSGKDKAEHVMIVDLERNDLGKVCEYGSVEVTEFEALESYSTVHHLVSTVRGRLREGVGPIGCIRACFPGGSITGAPKVRAIELIDEAEPAGRGLYTGSIGYIGYDGSMDLNIVIRTMIITGGRLFFNVGGGIVADSDPGAEYDETIDKALALLESVGAGGYGMRSCVNGRLVDEGEPSVSPLDYGLLYGYGLYETMRADNGRVFRLRRHLARLREAAKLIGIPLKWTDAEFEAMIMETLKANCLSDAYVRLTVTRGSGEPRLSFPKDTRPTLIITARKLPDGGMAAARLAVSRKFTRYSRDIRSGIKSTNFLINALAKAEATERKADDVILLNEKGDVTECSTANIFLVSDGRLMTPALGSGLLPGIVREAVIELAKEDGIPFDEREVPESELLRAQEIFKTSSIAGVVPVLELDGRPVGFGKPGKLTLELQKSYARLRAREGA